MAKEAGYSIEQYTALISNLVERTRKSGDEISNSVKMRLNNIIHKLLRKFSLNCIMWCNTNLGSPIIWMTG